MLGQKLGLAYFYPRFYHLQVLKSMTKFNFGGLSPRGFGMNPCNKVIHDHRSSQIQVDEFDPTNKQLPFFKISLLENIFPQPIASFRWGSLHEGRIRFHPYLFWVLNQIPTQFCDKGSVEILHSSYTQYTFFRLAQWWLAFKWQALPIWILTLKERSTGCINFSTHHFWNLKGWHCVRIGVIVATNLIKVRRPACESTFGHPAI